MGKRTDMWRNTDTSAPEYARLWRTQRRMTVFGTLAALVWLAYGVIQHVTWWTVVGVVALVVGTPMFWILARAKPTGSPDTNHP